MWSSLNDRPLTRNGLANWLARDTSLTPAATGRPLLARSSLEARIEPLPTARRIEAAQILDSQVVERKDGPTTGQIAGERESADPHVQCAKTRTKCFGARGEPESDRMNRRPGPGQPLANIESSLRKNASNLSCLVEEFAQAPNRGWSTVSSVQGPMIPRFTPIIAAWVRSFASNFERMFLTRPLTVSSVIER
jgi:hypothetical protein